MAGQNRSSYVRSNGGANRGLAAFFRGAFILLVALTLSFGLGFFVIARMVPPGTPDSAGSGNGSGGESNGGAPASTHANHRPQNSNSSESPSQAAVKPGQPGSSAQDGPELLPEGDVQKPDKLETSGANSNSNGADDADSADSKTHGGSKTENDGSTGATPTTADESGDTSGQRHSRQGRSSETGAVQPAGSPDSSSPETSDASKAAMDASPAVKTGVYRVQIGVYSTREKAEEVAQSAADKGITTSLHVVKRDGRTLYRVQQSTHRDRAKAELDRQKLIDAGFDATIINP
jgi:cell division protein FtsN